MMQVSWSRTLAGERPDVLVGDDPDRIAEALEQAAIPPNRPQLYGDGHAAERIAEVLVTLSE